MLDADNLRILLQGCARLTSLHTYCFEDETQCMQVLAQLGTNLTSLVIRKNTSPTNAAMVAMLQACRQLRTLKLDAEFIPNRLTDVAFKAIGENCPLLEELALKHMDHLTDVGMRAIASGCPLLRSVTLKRTSVTNDGFVCVLRSCPQLVNLALRKCKDIDEEGMLSILKLRPEITDLTIVGMSHGNGLLKSLANGLRKLRSFTVDYFGANSPQELQEEFGAAILVRSVGPDLRDYGKRAWSHADYDSE
jgi:F-box/leucine-rich repeat protein 2/20